ncbi:MAG TPA: MBL fold metallo-hydrolase, partial [Vicinamibacterales bacterium]|nr:MBL fold metallo-hydrolase [Vicinamibacterales bacterium]
MKRPLVLGSIVVAGMLTAAVAAQQRPPPPPSVDDIAVEKVKDNLFVLRATGTGNTAVFVTANGVTIVDTKSPGWGQPLLDKIKTLTDKPVTTVINTHFHFDHAHGNQIFEPGVQIIGHEFTRRALLDDPMSKPLYQSFYN